MRGLTINENDQLGLSEIDEPQVMKSSDVKVKIDAAGVCGSDLKIISGKIPAVQGMVLGHEAVGTVVEIGGSVASLSVGDKVIVDPTQSCGTCGPCRKGENCYCDNFDDHQLGMSLHGTFTEYYVGHEKYLYKVPVDMDWRTAVLVEPLCCALNSVTKAKIKATDNVLVIGCGTIGLLSQVLAGMAGRKVVGIDIDDYRLKFASEYNSNVLAAQDLTIEKTLELNQGRKFDVIIDAVGNQVEKALELIEKGGRIVPMGLSEDYELTMKPVDFVNYGLTMTGDVALHSAIGRALEVAEELPEIAGIVTKQYVVEDFEKAISELEGSAGTRSSMKTVFTF